MIRYLVFPMLLAGCTSTPAALEPQRPTLEQSIRARIAQIDSAEVAVSLVDLETGRELHINDDIVMHAASTMKVPVLLELFRQAEAGTRSLEDGIPVFNSFKSIADTSTYSLSPADDSDSTLYTLVGKRVTLHELARLMIVRSSNLATNILIDLVKAENVRNTVREIGGNGMTVMRGVEDIPAYERGMNNTTTSRGYANVLAAIARCNRFKVESCQQMLRILEGQEFKDMIPAGVPNGVRVANKTGSITRIQHDGAIVFPPNRAPYVLVVLTRGITDHAVARKLGADISRMVWQHTAPMASGEAVPGERYRVSALATRVFTHNAYWSAVEPYLDAPLVREQVGTSVEGRPLYLVRFGDGPTKVLLWSQMHGDESTATLALADLMRYLHDANDERTASWRRQLTILMLPMLNPDGAETFQRQNALGIDINRDARVLATPEGRVLKGVLDRYKPHFGFNLHDQNVRTRIGSTDRIASVALLAPAFDSARSDNAVRVRAKQVAAVIRDAIEPFVPDQVAKYDDSFNPRAFGDLVQRWGTSTVLIESGGRLDDPQKQYLRQVNVVGITAALDAIASGSYAKADVERYESLLMNGPAAYDVVIRGGMVVLRGYGPYRADIAINRAERNGTPAGASIAEVGDLAGTHARDTIEASGLFIHPAPSARETIARRAPRVNIGDHAAFTITSDSAGREPVYSIEGETYRKLATNEARPAGPPHVAVGCYTLELGPWQNRHNNTDFLKAPAAIELLWTLGTYARERGGLVMRPHGDANRGLYSIMIWKAPAADRIELIFSTGFAGMIIPMQREGEVFRGTAKQFTDVGYEGKIDPTAAALLRRMPCGQPQ